MPGPSSFADLNELHDRDGLTPNSGQVASVWNQSYEALANINLLLEEVPGIDDARFLENRKQEILAEARALRAFIYFHLVRFYGEIPLRTTFPREASASANAIARSAVSEIYNLIFEDLIFAEQNLPPVFEDDLAFPGATFEVVQSKGRFTQNAVRALLARIYLTLGDFTMAAQKADEVENSGLYTLVDDYGLVFGLDPDGEGSAAFSGNSAESILETQYVPNNDNTGGQIFFYLDGYPPRYSPSRILFREYNPEDTRRTWNIGLADPPQDTILYMIKYRKFFGSNDPDNYIVFRLAEMLLIQAEALNELSYPSQEALDKLNALRTRAGVPVYSFVELNSQEAFRQAVREERRFELAFEGIGGLTCCGTAHRKRYRYCLMKILTGSCFLYPPGRYA
ncbi:MAG: RagB/SusD family nutrient uptake outer membrane protein [Bacteroidia bacterium]|nr:RagB/SusD family nutrient uptake outer membrane protein [Bacteroidia bacterium]